MQVSSKGVVSRTATEGKSLARIGVTGATGFIGGLLVPTLVAEGYELRLVDNRSGPVQVEPRERTCEDLDFAGEPALRLLSDCDAVLHLAAASGVVLCARDPEGTARVNVEGTRRLYDMCRDRRIPVLFASSFAVVGAPRQLPVREDTPAQPTHEYARQKTAGEVLTRDLARRAGTPCAILRQSNVYGGYVGGRRLVTKSNVLELFARQTREGTLRVKAPGTQRRDYVHIAEVAAHWVAALRYVLGASAPATAPTFNVASGETRSVLELADDVSKAYGRLHPEAEPLRVKVVDNPRAGIELVEPGFAVDRSWTERPLQVPIRHGLDEEIPVILRAAEASEVSTASA